MNNPTVARYAPGDIIQHARFGRGRIELDKDQTALVRFEHGIEECEKASLTQQVSPAQAIQQQEWHRPLEVLLRVQAETILSINDMWGVFSRSRIALLPHQLWVCRQVLERLPTRWLIADDVGLGKTIEAGLVLMPLLSKGLVKRLLILCPASLVEQWVSRMATMFDIRATAYVPEADTPKTNYWNTHNQVVASLHTLRLDRGGRHERIFASEPWDLVIVDEAHHLYVDEEQRETLGFKFVERLEKEQKIRSMLFFTGTPHRGKNHGFWSLLRLLRPELFAPELGPVTWLKNLRQVMIRNNKQNVTDLKGEPLFQAPRVTAETYAYSPAEARFYEMLTEFIATGKAYASTLSALEGKTVMLVLIAMQKLASSSVAAIRRALQGRLTRLQEKSKELEKKTSQAKQIREWMEKYEGLQAAEEQEQLNKLDEAIAELTTEIMLMADEAPRLKELVTAAEAVGQETKIAHILSLVDGKFAQRQVLFFTEYKATQSLLMSSLALRYGLECVAFINGDNKAEGVVDEGGKTRTLTERRDDAADRFNAGKARFLISTEAGGEGIDLQARCHTLIHVDLPWNPMRLHQRVGRLNRYGQRHQVEVVSLHNPDTVESRIWEKLNEKLERITFALGMAMDEPEDLLQLVLGMTSQTFFQGLFVNGGDVPPGSLNAWFDKETSTFGGQNIIDLVKDLIGNCATFDFQQVADQIPRVDLEELKPFFTAMLAYNHRKYTDDSVTGLEFKTPDDWRTTPSIMARYEGLRFQRSDITGPAAKKIVGVGLDVLDKALQQAKGLNAVLAAFPSKLLPAPVVVFRIHDRVTEGKGSFRNVIVGVNNNTLLADWKLALLLNDLLNNRTKLSQDESVQPNKIDAIAQAISISSAFLSQQLPELNLPFKMPEWELLAVLWPVT